MGGKYFLYLDVVLTILCFAIIYMVILPAGRDGESSEITTAFVSVHFDERSAELLSHSVSSDSPLLFGVLRHGGKTYSVFDAIQDDRIVWTRSERHLSLIARLPSGAEFELGIGLVSDAGTASQALTYGLGIMTSGVRGANPSVELSARNGYVVRVALALP